MFTQIHFLWLLPLLLLAGFISYLLYFYKNKSLNPKVKIVLFCLRFLYLSLIGVILLQPFFISHKSTEYPSRVILAVDVSKSIPLKSDTNIILKKIKEFSSYDWKNLKSEIMYFGENTSDTFDGYQQSFTNIQQLVQHIQQSYPAYSVPHIVLMSDGIINSGNELKYIQTDENKIHTILLGDSTLYPQIKINAVYHNKTAYLNNEFTVGYEINFQKFKGQNTVLKWYFSDTIQQQKQAEIRLDKQLISGDLVLKAKKSGLQKISLEIVNQKGKLLQKQESFIKVIDDKKNIIVVYNSPHPDVAAIQSALENFKNYSVKICATEGLKMDELIKQNLIIFVGIPNAETWKMIEKSKTNLLLFPTQVTNVNLQNTFVNIQSNNKKSDEVFVSNANQSYLKLDNSSIVKLPPVYKLNANYNLKGDKITVWNCRYGNVETDKPLLQFSTVNQQKIGVFWASGIWRWNLTADEEQKKVFQSWINQLTAYLTVDKQNERLQVQHKDWYYENEKILFNAWSYFKNLELNKEAELELTIQNKKNKNSYKLYFQQNKYVVPIQNLSAGEYTYKLQSNYPKDTLSVKGKFVVSEQNIEFMDTQAKWKDLQLLSSKTLGKSILPEKLFELLNEINESEYPIIESTVEKKISILDYYILFLIIIVLWFAEWLIRKFYLSI
jgi:hypothetical protein